MPLSPPAKREPLHNRTIHMVGYLREDGLYDVEAHLVDTKTYTFSNTDRGEVTPGTPLHGMLARMTLDMEMTIVAFEADTEFGPYTLCPTAAPNFGRLAGLRIGRGFVRAANERVGGTVGCTHLREMLGQMATVAYQTLYSIRMHRRTEPNTLATAEAANTRPAQIGTCLAYAPDGPVVKRTWPDHYTGA